MKYGLLYYKDTDNIGDDIQSYAASKFLPRIDYMIDREHLNDFSPNKKEFVKTIMNAWYIHDKFNFDISPYIFPLFVSMFFKRFPYEAGITVGTDYINENVRSMLRNYSPVGCRDKHTLKIMQDFGIDCYFSGCMTLTLDRFKNVKKGDYIVTVGLSKKEVSFIKSKTKRKVIEFVQDVKTGSFKDESWDTRKNRVEDTLKLYQGAHLVITTKLHCSLPCLALEVPVLLLYDTSFDENKDRIGTYLSYLNHINRNELFNLDYDFEKPKSNPKKYLSLRNALIERCSTFVKDDYGDISLLPNTNDYTTFINRSNIQKRLIIKYMNELSKTYENECKKSGRMQKKINDLKYQNQELKDELECIKNSKGWKMLEKLRKIKNRR